MEENGHLWVIHGGNGNLWVVHGGKGSFMGNTWRKIVIYGLYIIQFCQPPKILYMSQYDLRSEDSPNYPKSESELQG